MIGHVLGPALEVVQQEGAHLRIDDGILYAFGVDRDDKEILMELYWASYVA